MVEDKAGVEGRRKEPVNDETIVPMYDFVKKMKYYTKENDNQHTS